MSSRFASDQLSRVRRDVPGVGPGAQHELHGLIASGVEDVDVASRSPARLLITASTPQSVEEVARRIHERGPRAKSPFVVTPAIDLPVEARALSEECHRLLEVAGGGSVLVTAVEEMPAAAQEMLIDALARLESVRGSAAGFRLISGTTVSLLDRVADGTFSEPLFYRLNVIHVMVGNVPHAAAVVHALARR